LSNPNTKEPKGSFVFGLLEFDYLLQPELHPPKLIGFKPQFPDGQFD
jgi:hypothetical protein